MWSEVSVTVETAEGVREVEYLADPTPSDILAAVAFADPWEVIHIRTV